MEFNLATDIKKSVPQAIVFNFEELKTELTEKIEPYTSMAVTEDDLKGAKSDKATLNKLKKALNDKKIEVKKEYMTPLEQFETQVKELIEIVDSGVINIDSQVKTFEQKQTQEKLNDIATFYVQEIGEYAELLPLERIIPEKWQNKGTKMDEIQKEITEKIFKFKNDIKIIKAMNLECEQQMLDSYIRTLDMSSALAEKTAFEERQERLKKIEQEKAERAKAEQDIKVVEEQPKAAETVTEQPQRTVDNTKTIDVRFFNTTEQFRADMKALTTKHNIRYGNVPKGE